MSSLPVEQVLCQLAGNTLCATPQSIKNPLFDRFFPDLQAITNAFLKFRPAVSAKLVQLLQSQASLSLQELKEVSAMEPTKSTWGVYLLFMEMEEVHSRLYTGSGTHSQTGIEGAFQKLYGRCQHPSEGPRAPGFGV